MSLRNRVIKAIDYKELIKRFSLYQLATVFHVDKNFILAAILEQEKIEAQKIEQVSEMDMQTNGEWSALKETEIYKKIMF